MKDPKTTPQFAIQLGHRFLYLRRCIDTRHRIRHLRHFGGLTVSATQQQGKPTRYGTQSRLLRTSIHLPISPLWHALWSSGANNHSQSLVWQKPWAWT